MKKLSFFEKLVSVAFVGGLLCCFAALPVAFASPETARILFFGGGSLGLIALIYTMIKGTYFDELP